MLKPASRFTRRLHPSWVKCLQRDPKRSCQIPKLQIRDTPEARFDFGKRSTANVPAQSTTTRRQHILCKGTLQAQPANLCTDNILFLGAHALRCGANRRGRSGPSAPFLERPNNCFRFPALPQTQLFPPYGTPLDSPSRRWFTLLCFWSIRLDPYEPTTQRSSLERALPVPCPPNR